MTNLEEALCASKPRVNGMRHAINTRPRAGLFAILYGGEISVSVALGEELLVEIDDWRRVAQLEGWLAV